MNEINNTAAKAVGWFFVLLFVMTGCGFVTLVVSVLYLMSLGSKLHGNYEYFGNYPLLYLGPVNLPPRLAG